MPNVSAANAGRFAALRRSAADALTRVNAARKEARRQGQVELERQLLVLREQLRDQMRAIDEAEDAFERSSMSVAEAEALLKQAVGAAKSAVAAMTGVVNTLNKVTEVVSILRGLVTLFT